MIEMAKEYDYLIVGAGIYGVKIESYGISFLFYWLICFPHRSFCFQISKESAFCV